MRVVVCMWCACGGVCVWYACGVYVVCVCGGMRVVVCMWVCIWWRVWGVYGVASSERVAWAVVRCSPGDATGVVLLGEKLLVCGPGFGGVFTRLHFFGSVMLPDTSPVLLALSRLNHFEAARPLTQQTRRGAE